jgi:hypothetical protein
MAPGKDAIQDVRQGILPPSYQVSTNTPCLIIAEHWASWLSACQRYSFTCISVIALCLISAVKNYFSSLYPMCQCITSIPASLHIPTCVFLQGSSRFLSECLASIPLSRASTLICCDESVTPKDPSPTWHCRRYNFVHYGGVVDGFWQFQSPAPLPSTLDLPHEALHGVCLMHFLEDTVPGGGRLPHSTGAVGIVRSDIFAQDSTLFGGALCFGLQPLQGHSKELNHRRVSDHLFSAERIEQSLDHHSKCVSYQVDCCVGTRGLTHSDMFEVTGFPPLYTPSPQFDFLKAVKADDAETPTFLWDDRIWTLGYHVPCQRSTHLRRFANRCPLTAIRDFSLRWWRRRVLKSLLGYLCNAHGPQWSHNPDARHEKEVGADCLRRAAGADWWEWRQGSTLMFWRWPEYARKLALEGHKPWFKYTPPGSQVPQRPERDAELRLKIRHKLDGP